MTQQSVWQAVRRSALDAQAALRTDRADRERRLEGLAAAVLTALGERDALVREASGALVGRCWRCSPCFCGSRSTKGGSILERFRVLRDAESANTRSVRSLSRRHA